MTVLSSSFKATSIEIRGLEVINLPFISHIFDNASDEDPAYRKLFADQADKYFVKSISGLGPPDQNVAIASTASGGKFQGKSSADREIVMLLGLNPNWDKGESPKILRDNLYTLISTGYDPRVELWLFAGIFPVAKTVAYVTKFEEELFSKDPVVQITFTCLNPVFSALSTVSYAPSELHEKRPNVYNFGTAETGFQFAVKFTGTMNKWYIKQADHKNIGMTFNMTFHANDVLAVSTIPGQRYIHWNKRRGKVQNKLGALTNDSEWITLHPGSNIFLVPSGVNWNWKGNLTFRPLYWGA